MCRPDHVHQFSAIAGSVYLQLYVSERLPVVIFTKNKLRAPRRTGARNPTVKSIRPSRINYIERPHRFRRVPSAEGGLPSERWPLPPLDMQWGAGVDAAKRLHSYGDDWKKKKESNCFPAKKR